MSKWKELTIASNKIFRLRADQIKSLAPGCGGCTATDMITVEGHKVGFMYREEADNKLDSGWRFTAGVESQEYMGNPKNMEVYDVNTFANYDPQIIPLLDSPVGSTFEWSSDSSKFIEVDFQSEE
jgi:hypothetical protein